MFHVPGFVDGPAKSALENSGKLRDVSERCRSYFVLRKVGLTYADDHIMVTSLQSKLVTTITTKIDVMNLISLAINLSLPYISNF